MSAERPYKRKLLNFSIKREMQFKIIGKIFLLLFVSLLLSGLIFYYFADQQVTSSFQMFHIKARNFLDFLLPVVIASFFVSLLVGVVGSLFFPKPITGGLYRVEQGLQRVIEQGDLTLQITLREGDQVTGLAGQMNSLVSDLRGRFGRISREVERLEGSLDTEAIADIEDRLQVARQACEQLRIELRQLNY